MSTTTDRPATLPAETAAYAAQFFDAARRGDVSSFTHVLPAGLPPNIQNDKGDTFLMLASYNGHASLVSLLLAHGANPNILNDRGQSCLAGAIFKHEESVIECLLAGGADPEWGNPSADSCVVMFKSEERWKEAFGTAKGRGKGGEEWVMRKG